MLLIEIQHLGRKLIFSSVYMSSKKGKAKNQAENILEELRNDFVLQVDEWVLYVI